MRERRRLWSSRPGAWVLAASAIDIGVVSILAVSGTLMEPVSPHVLAMIFGAAVAFALILDQVKRPVLAAFKIG